MLPESVTVPVPFLVRVPEPVAMASLMVMRPAPTKVRFVSVPVMELPLERVRVPASLPIVVFPARVMAPP